MTDKKEPSRKWVGPGQAHKCIKPDCNRGHRLQMTLAHDLDDKLFELAKESAFASRSDMIHWVLSDFAYGDRNSPLVPPSVVVRFSVELDSLLAAPRDQVRRWAKDHGLYKQPHCKSKRAIIQAAIDHPGIMVIGAEGWHGHGGRTKHSTNPRED